MTEKIISYKYCLVPRCLNTTKRTPHKYFFPVPRHKDLRIKWSTAMKRIGMVPLSYKTSLHCCQDHFDLEYDVCNYIKYKLVGGRMVLKSGILPHRFECYRNQDDTLTEKDIPPDKLDPMEVVSCFLGDMDVCDIRKYKIPSSIKFLRDLSTK